MKLRILAAASAVVIGGAAFAVYRETRHDTAATSASSPTRAERAAPSTPTPSERATSSARSGATTSDIPRPTSSVNILPEAPAGPAPPSSADAIARSRIQGTTTVRPETGAGSAAPTRRGVTSIKVRPADAKLGRGAPDSPAARQQRMNNTIESAACHAPDLEQRYRRLPENERAALRARCAKYGVKLPDLS